PPMSRRAAARDVPGREAIGKCRHDEQVHRGDVVGGMIAKKGPPTLCPFLLLVMYLAMLVWPMSMPSLSNSPWMRGAPQGGWPCSWSGSTDGPPPEPSVPRRAAATSNAKTIEIQHGANEPRSRAGRWPAHLQFQKRGDTAQRTPIGREF